MNPRRNVSEDELVAACRRGERGAQRELFEQHNLAVFRTLLALNGNAGEAEDLLQETFLRAYRAIGGFRGHSSIRTWLMRIATNAFYEARRREQTRRRYLSEVEPADAQPALQVVTEGDEARERLDGFRDLVLRGLAKLSVTDRTVLTLHEIEGYRYAEIAEILDIAPGTVGSRLNRARERLRHEIRGLLSLDPEEILTLEHLYNRVPSCRQEPGQRPEQARRNEEG